MKLSELRKELKAIGYKVKTETLSYGKHATFTDMTGTALPTMFGGEEHRKQWIVLIDYLTANKERLIDLSQGSEGMYGLRIV